MDKPLAACLLPENNGLGMPGHWVKTKLGEVVDLNPPKPPKDGLPPDAEVTFVPMPAVDAQSGAITSPESRPFASVRKGYTSFRNGDVIFAKITPCMENGKAAIASDLINGLGFGSTEFHVMRPRESVIPEYVYYYIRQESFRRAAEAEMTGSVGQKRVPSDFLRNADFPLPPVVEQERIVAKIEELLPKVNAVRERLIRVKEIMKRFRQSVLAAACSGRLTEDWRNLTPAMEIEQTLVDTPESKNNRTRKVRAGRLWGAGVIPDLTDEELNSLPSTWSWVRVRDLGNDPDEVVQVGPMSMRSRDFADSGVPVLNVGCVQWGHFDESKLNHLPQSSASSFERYRISKSDVLFTRSGTVGRCAIATQGQEGYLMTFHLLRVRTAQNKCLPEYLLIVFQGAPHIRRQTEEGAIGSTRAGFNTNLLAELSVPLPQLLEQREIVCRVESLFKIADTIEKRVENELIRTEKMIQAVLAKAFRCELVPTKAELV